MILVTGASGFVGQALHERLLRQGFGVRPATRRPMRDSLAIGDIDGATDWTEALRSIETVVHLAARVHVMRDTVADPLAAFRTVNRDGTINLARQAAQQGVRRLVFISSIKVNGESTPEGMAFTPDDVPAPADPYAVSKWEAEDALLRIARETGMQVVVIRPPLIYGPRVKANFLSLMKWLERGVPLPLGAIHNCRTLVSLDNLVDLIVTCVGHPAASNEIFLSGDPENLSTTALLRRLARAMNVPARLVPVPAPMLIAAAALFGRSAAARRLCGNLQVDISKAQRLLAWTPPVPVDEGLRRTAAYYLHPPGS